MKKILYIVLIILDILCLIVTKNISDILRVSSDIESTTMINDTLDSNNLYLNYNYSVDYFYNLNQNFGRNDKGSCTYVALAQLLSFWDTSWDDSLIDENFDSISLLSENKLELNESPGIRQETFNARSMTAQQYYDQIETMWGGYFHLFLIKKGKELFKQFCFDNDASPCGLTASQLQELIKYYLYSYKKYSEEDFKILFVDENVKEFAIKMIKIGYPVELRMGKSSTGGGHAMIAYDYDEETDTIYVHPGWKTFSTHVSLSKLGYDEFWDATCIVPIKEHSCSNNYLYSCEYESKSFCPCELNSLPRKYEQHVEHLYNDHYEKLSSLQHLAYCKCGEYIVTPHSVKSNSMYVRKGHTYGVCYCGCLIDLGITPIIAEEYSLNI